MRPNPRNNEAKNACGQKLLPRPQKLNKSIQGKLRLNKQSNKTLLKLTYCDNFV